MSDQHKREIAAALGSSSAEIKRMADEGVLPAEGAVSQFGQS
jgi:hypothetical protein